jgi:polyphenol oxidase
VPGRLSPLPAGFPDGGSGVFTTRLGGVSEPPWDELNLADHVGDDPRDVRANRARLAAYLGGPSVRFSQLVHGADVLTVGPTDSTEAVVADALVTAVPGIPIGVLVADCLPVLLYDPVHRVVGAAHAGRRGLAAGVLEQAVTAMVALGADVTGCLAVIGPGICGRCYEVPAQLRDEVAAVVPDVFAQTGWGTPSLDLPAGAVAVLRRAGIGSVRLAGTCTATDPRLYSYRRDATTGRFAGVVMLAVE